MVYEYSGLGAPLIKCRIQYLVYKTDVIEDGLDIINSTKQWFSLILTYYSNVLFVLLLHLLKIEKFDVLVF